MAEDHGNIQLAERSVIRSRSKQREQWIVTAPDHLMAGCLTALEELEWPERHLGLIVFVRRRKPPLGGARADGAVDAFAFPAQEWSGSLVPLSHAAQQHACYKAVRAAMLETSGGGILVRQVPTAPKTTPDPASWESPVLIPHRGEHLQLYASLAHVGGALGGSGSTHVALDQALDDDTWEVTRHFPGVNFYTLEPCPSGPYQAVAKLLSVTRGELFALQDSDDVPCMDRFASLAAALHVGRTDIVGSHEIRVDDIAERVYAFRFPINATRALLNGAGHAILHPTCAIRRSAYERAGGFSTFRRAGLDFQFHLRACLRLSMVNIDEFLYVRRTHPRCLTRAAETGMQSKERRDSVRQWKTDLQMVRMGLASVDETSLRVQRRMTNVRLKRVQAPKEA